MTEISGRGTLAVWFHRALEVLRLVALVARFTGHVLGLGTLWNRSVAHNGPTTMAQHAHAAVLACLQRFVFDVRRVRASCSCAVRRWSMLLGDCRNCQQTA
eukprot:5957529-Alexandrium_andersonii.AAC.2